MLKYYCIGIACTHPRRIDVDRDRSVALGISRSNDDDSFDKISELSLQCVERARCNEAMMVLES